MEAPATKPGERELRAPLVYVLGRLCGYRPYVGVPLEKVRDEVLRLLGITPENSPWPLKSTSSKTRDGLYRKVHFTWYHQTRQYRPQMNALCARPISGRRGEWALTLLGVEEARRLRERYEGT